MNRTVTLTLLGLAWCSAVAAAPPQDTRAARVEKGLLPPVTFVGDPTRTMSIADRMAHHKVPAVSLAVIEGDRIAWARAYGTLTRTGHDPATVETLFQAGSLSKPVTAAGALSLAHRGKLSLDGAVNGYLTSWKAPRSEKAEGRPVTLRGILSHTAGLTVHGFRGYAIDEKAPTLRQVLDGSPPANSAPVRIDQAPGSALRYSGGGYVVAQQVIEDVTGRPFAEVLRETVLRPIGMAHSTYAQPLPEALSRRAAVGYAANGGEVQGRWRVFPELGAAGLWSTSTDLARFTLWLIKGAKGDVAPVQRAVASEMLEPQRDLAGKDFITPAGNRTGLGLVLEGEGASLRFSHSGSNPGQKSFMIGFPETGQGAVVMANSDTSPALIQEILRSIAAEYRWPERFHRIVRPATLPQAALLALAGTYRFQSRERDGKMMEIIVGASDGALLARLPDGTKHRLRPLSATRFLDPDTQMTLDFVEPGAVRAPTYGVTARRD